MSGTEGAYVAYPFEDLLGILALESHRQGCLVIGEDLGTVPEGFRSRLERAGLLSCRVLLFEREEDGALKPPSACPEAALVSASTHDLPTLRGYWQGRDLDWRLRLEPRPDPAAHGARRAERAGDRRALLDALDRAGLLPQGVEPGSPPDELSLDLLVALHRLLGRWRGRLLAVQLEDALFELDQVNLPGTVDEHPNWRRRLRLPLESLFDDPTVQAVLGAVRAERR
jgi:4-alpha-glucanotransferase